MMFTLIENEHLNKQKIAEGDETAVMLLRKRIAEEGMNVGEQLGMDASEKGKITIYQPPPEFSLGMRNIRRFSMRAMNEKDWQYQKNLERARKQRGGIKVREWDHTQNKMVTREMSAPMKEMTTEGGIVLPL